MPRKAKKETVPSGPPISYTDEELLEIKNECLSGREERCRVYDDYARVVLTNELKNPLFKHLEDVTSLIYLPDNIIFDIVVEPPAQPNQDLVRELKRKLSDDFFSEGLDLMLYDVILWSLIYGSYFVKVYLNDKNEIKYKKVSPHDICVLYEDKETVDRGQVILHVTRLPKHIAKQRYGDLPEEELTEVTTPQRPEARFLNIVYSQTKGRVPPEETEWQELPLRPKATGRYVELYEMWLWDEGFNDYLMVQFVGNRIIKSRNPFIPQEQPIIGLRVNHLENYFFGLSELHFLRDIHDNLKRQLLRIKDTEDLLQRPPMIVSGLTGTIEAIEIEKKLRTPGSVTEILDPTGRIDFYLPKLTPEILYKSLEYWETTFKEMTGVIGVLGGRPTPGVRSASHASLLAQFAAAPLKKKALRVEHFIESLMSLHANIKTKTDKRFSDLVAIPLRVEVFAHTSSPIVATFYQDLLIELAKAGLVPPETVIDVLPLPEKDLIKKRLTQAPIVPSPEPESK